MKFKNADGSVTVAAEFKGIPPKNFQPKSSRPFTLGFDVTGTNPYLNHVQVYVHQYWPHLGVDLAGDVAVDYDYQLFYDFDACQHVVDILNHAQVDVQSGLSGGEYFNYIIRSMMTSKVVFG